MRGEQPRSLVQAVRVHTALLYLLRGGFASRSCHGIGQAAPAGPARRVCVFLVRDAKCLWKTGPWYFI